MSRRNVWRNLNPEMNRMYKNSMNKGQKLNGNCDFNTPGNDVSYIACTSFSTNKQLILMQKAVEIQRKHKNSHNFFE